MLKSRFITASTPSVDHENTSSIDISSIFPTKRALPKQVDKQSENLLDFSSQLDNEKKFWAQAREARKQREILKKKEKQNHTKNQVLPEKDKQIKKEGKEQYQNSSEKKRRISHRKVPVEVEKEGEFSEDDFVIKKKVAITASNETVSSASTTQSVCQSPSKDELFNLNGKRPLENPEGMDEPSLGKKSVAQMKRKVE